MSIKTTLGQLNIAAKAGALAHVSAVIPPGGYHFRVAKLLDAVEAELKGYAKQELALYKKYGVPHTVEKDGKKVATGGYTMMGAPIESITAFNDALLALQDEETTIPYEPIIWSKLGLDSPEKTKQVCPQCGKELEVEVPKGLSINDVRALGPLLVEEDPNAPAAPVPPPAAAAALPAARRATR